MADLLNQIVFKNYFWSPF